MRHGSFNPTVLFYPSIIIILIYKYSYIYGNNVISHKSNLLNSHFLFNKMKGESVISFISSFSPLLSYHITYKIYSLYLYSSLFSFSLFSPKPNNLSRNRCIRSGTVHPESMKSNNSNSFFKEAISFEFDHPEGEL